MRNTVEPFFMSMGKDRSVLSFAKDSKGSVCSSLQKVFTDFLLKRYKRYKEFAPGYFNLQVLNVKREIKCRSKKRILLGVSHSIVIAPICRVPPFYRFMIQ